MPETLYMNKAKLHNADRCLSFVRYKSIDYPIRSVYFWDMNVRIATESFCKALLDEETGLPTCHEAEVIDNTIFYFVQDSEIYLPEHELLQLLENQVS